MTQAIRVEDVHKRFGSLHALKGVSFGIEQGEYFGLLGPNGAGKSTLINITAGLVRATAGAVAVMGHDVVGAFRPARQSLGVVLQEIVYDPFFRCATFCESRLATSDAARTSGPGWTNCWSGWT